MGDGDNLSVDVPAARFSVAELPDVARPNAPIIPPTKKLGACIDLRLTSTGKRSVGKATTEKPKVDEKKDGGSITVRTETVVKITRYVEESVTEELLNISICGHYTRTELDGYPPTTREGVEGSVTQNRASFWAGNGQTWYRVRHNRENGLYYVNEASDDIDGRDEAFGVVSFDSLGGVLAHVASGFGVEVALGLVQQTPFTREGPTAQEDPGRKMVGLFIRGRWFNPVEQDPDGAAAQSQRLIAAGVHLAHAIGPDMDDLITTAQAPLAYRSGDDLTAMVPVGGNLGVAIANGTEFITHSVDDSPAHKSLAFWKAISAIFLGSLLQGLGAKLENPKMVIGGAALNGSGFGALPKTLGAESNWWSRAALFFFGVGNGVVAFTAFPISNQDAVQHIGSDDVNPFGDNMDRATRNAFGSAAIGGVMGALILEF